MKKKFSLAVLN